MKEAVILHSYKKKMKEFTSPAHLETKDSRMYCKILYRTLSSACLRLSSIRFVYSHFPSRR